VGVVSEGSAVAFAVAVAFAAALAGTVAAAFAFAFAFATTFAVASDVAVAFVLAFALKGHGFSRAETNLPLTGLQRLRKNSFWTCFERARL
jgi:hypothetical protein